MTTRTHQFGTVTVKVWHDRSRVETRFPDGELQQRISDTVAAIAQNERAMASSDSPSLAATLRSLQKRLKILEAEYDGAVLVAEPEDTDDYRDRAASLGYESADELNREHDPLHSFLADKLGYRWSPCLYAAAYKSPLERKDADREEAMVLSFAAYMNDPTMLDAFREGRDEPQTAVGALRLLAMHPLIDAGLDLAGLRDEALEKLR